MTKMFAFLVFASSYLILTSHEKGTLVFASSRLTLTSPGRAGGKRKGGGQQQHLSPSFPYSVIPSRGMAE